MIQMVDLKSENVKNSIVKIDEMKSIDMQDMMGQSEENVLFIV